jgi:virulence-associated protein VapD
MTTLSISRPTAAAPVIDGITNTFPANFGSKEKTVVYAIAFDMDIEALRTHYGDPYNNAYLEIRNILESHGFAWQQGSTYFGGERINAVTCVLAAIDLSQKLPWFARSVRDIRMLRIEELNDLMPAVLGAANQNR